MSKALQRLFALVLAVAVCTALAFPAFATGAEGAGKDSAHARALDSARIGNTVDSGIVNTEQELLQWLELHQDDGGTVRLGQTITIKRGAYTLDYPGVITIDTGAYGLVFDGGVLYIGGESLLTGEGVDVPVLDVKSMGRMRVSDWSNALAALNVTATGREGVGGTAVALQGPGAGPHDTLQIYTTPPGKIRSYGEGAVGLLLQEYFSAYCLDIEVQGAGSTAVSAPEGALLSFCKLSATGENARSAAGDGVFVDTCIASPAAGAFVRGYTRCLTPAYVIVRQNSTMQELSWQLGRQYTYAPLMGGEVSSAIGGLLAVWDSAYRAIDLSVLGKTIIPGRVESYCAPGWFEQFVDVTGCKIVVDVRSPDVPCIYEVELESYLSDIEEELVELRLWTSDKWALDDLVFWRSDDGGKSWYQLGAEDSVVFVEDTQNDMRAVYFPASSITEGCMVQLECPGVGESNVIVFTMVDGQPEGGSGGDRTGTDRVIGVKPGGDKGDPPPPGNGDPPPPPPGNGDPPPPGNGDPPPPGNGDPPPPGNGDPPPDAGNGGDGNNSGNDGDGNNGGNDGDGNNGGNVDDNTPDDTPDNTPGTTPGGGSGSSNGGGSSTDRPGDSIEARAGYALLLKTEIVASPIPNVTSPRNPPDLNAPVALEVARETAAPSTSRPAERADTAPQAAEPQAAESAERQPRDGTAAIPMAAGAFALAAGAYCFLRVQLRRRGGG